MHKLNATIRTAAVGLFLVATTALASAQAQVVVKYSSWLPPTHWLNTTAVIPWMAEVEKATQGRVKIEMLPKTVGTPPSQFDVVRDGLADLGLIVTGYTPGRFELAEMGELPFLGEDPTVMSPAFDRVYRKHFAAANEFKGVEVMSIFTIAPGHIFTAKKQIRSIDDLKGMKLRSASATGTRALTLLGAVPILKSSTEAFEMLSTGAIDGSLMLQETVKSTNSVGLLRYGLLVPGGLFNSSLAVIVNGDKWKAISPADQRAIMGVSGEALAAKIGRAYAAADQSSVDAMKDAKYVLERADPALTQGLRKAMSPIEDEWIAKAKKKGVADPAAALAEFRAAVQSR
ncbi:MULTISPECIES: TRAP transporter substrate-binding protein [unclassified Variovorax]|uniref:TRAP transporter substrate-binding protein n=1 Tax=unclassified Variovorax TaxID=663243 RepID=UPI00076D8EBA|nr:MULTISPECIES: TRAP transporter substrate-binding protein [unclassified Variovorax]KWT73925.1 TRAP transporter solute receptor, unknown substrate 3 [Variovorax sp. WDL1]PNG52262.1 Outer membrane transporter protein TsaT [Variovorax sp. B4]PNG54802.1 Outer membrane transporter protein TsaT [Variovorax sp. B2]VTV15804.1 Extracytoplasmic solute receptor protein YiaO [Variovorax sp. WDL1]